MYVRAGRPAFAWPAKIRLSLWKNAKRKWSSTPYSPKLQTWGLNIRWFGVISRTVVDGWCLKSLQRCSQADNWVWVEEILVNRKQAKLFTIFFCLFVTIFLLKWKSCVKSDILAEVTKNPRNLPNNYVKFPNKSINIP